MFYIFLAHESFLSHNKTTLKTYCFVVCVLWRHFLFPLVCEYNINLKINNNWKFKILSFLLFLFGSMSSLTKKWSDIYACWGTAWPGAAIMYCSQFCTCVRNIGTRSKCRASGMSVICAVVTATSQANKCISISFVNLCIVYFHLEIIFRLISPGKIFISVSLKFIWNISNYYAKNWT